MDQSPDPFHALVSGLEYPMFIVTARSADEDDGCLVGFATQSSIDPPRLLVFVSKANRTYRVARDSSQLAVHFLHSRNMDLAELFGSATGDEIDKFSRCEWRRVEGLEPAVLSGTRGWAAGEMLSLVDGGDHMGFLLAVSAAALDDDGPPLGFQAARRLTPGHPA